MKVLLCGYHEAGYRALRTLIARGHDVLVATHPTPDGIPSVAALGRWLGIPYVEGAPDAVLATAVRFAPDIIFSVYYRTILPVKVTDLAPLGAYNFHPSLLPRHAGCFSAVWTILEGDVRTGVTCHRMIERVDAGDVVDAISVAVDDTDTGMSLYYKLVDATLVLFDRVLKRAEKERLPGKPQTGKRSHHRREVPHGGMIDPGWPRRRIERFIRALDFPPFPPACVEIQGARCPVRSLEQYDRVMRGPSEAAAQSNGRQVSTVRG